MSKISPKIEPVKNNEAKELSNYKEYEIEDRQKLSIINNMKPERLRNCLNRNGSENVDPEEIDSQSIHPFVHTEDIMNVKLPNTNMQRKLIKRDQRYLSNKRNIKVTDLNEYNEDDNLQINRVFKFPSSQSQQTKNRRRRKRLNN